MTVAPVASRSAAAAPMWSEWWCVSTMAASFRSPRASRMAGALHVGSTTNVAVPSPMRYTLFSNNPMTKHSTSTHAP